MGIKDHDNRLLDYVYDELDASERESFERKLEEDAALRAELVRVQSTRTMMQRVVDDEPPQELFYDLVREARKAVAQQHQPSLLQRFSAALLRPQAATALLVLVVAVTGVYLLDNTASHMPDDPRDVVSPTTLPSRGEVAAAHEPTPVMDEGAPAGPEESEAVARSEATEDDLESFGVASAEPAAEPASKADAPRSPVVADKAKVRPGKRRAKKLAKAPRSRARQVPAPAREQQKVAKAAPTSVRPIAVQPAAQGKGALRKESAAKRPVLARDALVQQKARSDQSSRGRVSLSAPALDDMAPSEASSSASERGIPEAPETQEAEPVKVEPYEAAMNDYRAQRYGQAINGFNRVLVDKKLRHRVYSARLHLARAYRKQKKTARALEQYRSVLQTKQSVSQRRKVLLETARLEMQAGMLGAARSHVLDALRGQKNPPAAAKALLTEVEERIRLVRLRKAKKKAKPAAESKKAKTSK
jgi:hypothetical protein